MKMQRAWLFWLAAPAAIALGLLAAGPSSGFGFDTGALGTALLLLTAWAGLAVASRAPEPIDPDVSPGEQRRWVALVFTIIIAIVIALDAGAIAAAGSASELRGLGRSAVALVIAWILFDAMVRHRRGDGIQEDERDRVVDGRADASAHTVLVFVLIGLAITLGLSPATRLQWATPLALAHLLVFVLVCASAIGSAVAVVLYRRDRA